MEKDSLPIQPYTDEDEYYQSLERRSFSNSEQGVPRTLGILYLILVLAFIIFHICL